MGLRILGVWNNGVMGIRVVNNRKMCGTVRVVCKGWICGGVRVGIRCMGCNWLGLPTGLRTYLFFRVCR